MIEEYVEFYGQGNFVVYAQASHHPTRVGEINNEGVVTGLRKQIYDRLSKLGIILKDTLFFAGKISCKGKIILPMLGAGEFDIGDPFNWFCRNAEIQVKFNKISEAFKRMQIFSKAIYQKIESSDYNPTICMSSNMKYLAEQKKSSVKPIVLIQSHEQMDAAGRMQNKRRVMLEANKREAESKKKALECCKHFDNIWMLDIEYHPSKLQAYIFFEIMLNHMLDVIRDWKDFDDNVYFHDISDCHRRAFCVLAGVLEMFLPYATEVTQAFKIDLKADDRLSGIFELKKKVVTSSMIAELKESQDLQDEVDALMKAKKKKNKAPAAPVQPEVVAKPEPVNQNAPKKLTLAQRKAEQVARKKIVEANKKITQETARNLELARKEAELARKDNGKGQRKKPPRP